MVYSKRHIGDSDMEVDGDGSGVDEQRKEGASRKRAEEWSTRMIIDGGEDVRTGTNCGRLSNTELATKMIERLEEVRRRTTEGQSSQNRSGRLSAKWSEKISERDGKLVR
jgi:hypothetical protein